MNSRKESEIIERIAELTGKPKSTLYEWKRNEKNRQLYEVLAEYVELKDVNLNSPEYMIQEIVEDLKGSSPKQIKIIYHCIKMKLEEIID